MTIHTDIPLRGRAFVPAGSSRSVSTVPASIADAVELGNVRAMLGQCIMQLRRSADDLDRAHMDWSAEANRALADEAEALRWSQ